MFHATEDWAKFTSIQVVRERWLEHHRSRKAETRAWEGVAFGRKTGSARCVHSQAEGLRGGKKSDFCSLFVMNCAVRPPAEHDGAGRDLRG